MCIEAYYDYNRSKKNPVKFPGAFPAQKKNTHTHQSRSPNNTLNTSANSHDDIKVTTNVNQNGGGNEIMARSDWLWINHGAHRTYTHLKWPKNSYWGYPSPAVHLWFSAAVWHSPPPSRPSWRLSPDDHMRSRSLWKSGWILIPKKNPQPTPFQTNMKALWRKISPFKGWVILWWFFCTQFFFRIYTVAWCTKQRIMTIQILSSLSLRGDQPNGWNIWNLRYFKVGKISMTILNLTFLGYLGPVIEVRLWKSSRSFIYNYQGLQGSILDQKLGVLFQPKKKLSLHLPLFLFSGKTSYIQ